MRLSLLGFWHLNVTSDSKTANNSTYLKLLLNPAPMPLSEFLQRLRPVRIPALHLRCYLGKRLAVFSLNWFKDWVKSEASFTSLFVCEFSVSSALKT